MTWLCDRHELVEDGWLSSAYEGHGILGSDVPLDTLGTLGLIAPYLEAGDEDREIRVYVDRPPSTLTTFFVGEDGRVDAAGPDGLHVGSAALLIDGAERGRIPIEIVVGDAVVAAPGAIYRVPYEGRIWRAR